MCDTYVIQVWRGCSAVEGGVGCPAGEWVYVGSGELAIFPWLSGPPLAKRTESEAAFPCCLCQCRMVNPLLQEVSEEV